MRYSQSFIPTLREIPRDAEIASHVLMLRGGYMRMLAAGLYVYLPLGWRVIRRVEQIIRDEMDRAGALEVLMPAMQPDDLWRRSGRWEAMGPEMVRLQDRNERQFVLGPTHEEVVTNLVAGHLRSWRDLPRNIYQIQGKFRDEVRPRFGVIRAREFIMKDAYSFDRDEESLDRSYWTMYDTYYRIFRRCGLDTRAVAADTGVMGGKFSHEFMALAAIGEEEIMIGENSDHASNIEVTPCPEVPAADTSARPAGQWREVHTPDVGTIKQVTAFLKREPQDFIKTLLFTEQKEDGQTFAVLVRGDREANPTKVNRLMGGICELADAATVEQITGAAIGFAGPVGLNVPIYADWEVLAMTGAVTGANKTDYHLVDVVPGVDFQPAGVGDLRFAVVGDPDPEGKGRLTSVRGIEVGQVFKLGTKYSEALNAYFTDQDGQDKPIIMGCYGIGVTRTVAAVIEQHHDDRGIIWPAEIAPYPASLLALAPNDPEVMRESDRIYAELQTAGIEVLYDDRDERPGAKFKDADLQGMPWQVVVGGKGLKEGIVELTNRGTGEKERIPLRDVVAVLAERVL